MTILDTWSLDLTETLDFRNINLLGALIFFFSSDVIAVQRVALLSSPIGFNQIQRILRYPKGHCFNFLYHFVNTVKPVFEA